MRLLFNSFRIYLDDILDFEEMQLRTDIHNGALMARAATKVADELLFQYVKTNDLYR